jgi:O-antigen/teichoic acid export membrane protein
MKQKALEFIKHPLVSGSSIIFAGSLFANFLNFLFNIFMTRNLSLADYGTVTSLISIIMMPALVSGSIVPTVINFGATYFAQNDLSMVKGLYYKITKPFSAIGVFLLLFFLIFAKEIGSFFNIQNESLIRIAGFTIFVTFIGAVNLALLQAKLAFTFITISNLASTIVKVAVGVAMIVLGYKAFGGMMAIFLSFLSGYLITLYPLRFIFERKTKVPNIEFKSLVSYGFPAALATFSLTSLITTDLVLVKHFFTPDEAGLYAVLSLIGRVIFFLTAPIGQVMFPLIVQKYAKDEDYRGIFLMAILLVLLPGIGMTAFYFIFPEFTIQFFNKQQQSLQMAPFLGFFGFIITLYALVSVLTNFFLSIKKVKVSYLVALGALSQALLIWLFHDEFIQIIITTLVIVSLLLFVLLLYYGKLHSGKEKT